MNIEFGQNFKVAHFFDRHIKFMKFDRIVFDFSCDATPKTCQIWSSGRRKLAVFIGSKQIKFGNDQFDRISNCLFLSIRTDLCIKSNPTSNWIRSIWIISLRLVFFLKKKI